MCINWSKIMKKMLFSLSVLGLFANADAMKQKRHIRPVSKRAMPAAAITQKHIGPFSGRAMPAAMHTKIARISIDLSNSDREYYSIEDDILFIDNAARVLDKPLRFKNVKPKLKNVKRVFLSNSNLERIRQLAFAGRDIEEVIMPDSLRELANRCFSNCKKLRQVIFGPSSNLQRIGKYAFTYTAIESLSIPDSVIELGYQCFLRCRSLRSVTFGLSSSLERVSERIFDDASKVQVNAPENVLRLLRSKG